MTTLSFSKPRGFRLAAAADFYAGFTPGCGMAAVSDDRLTLAFRLDGTFDAVAVALREEGDVVHAEYAGTTHVDALEKQVARMLGLDADGDAWADVGVRDPIVGGLQREFPGFFTAAKPSPYDAATWGIIAPRLSIAAAAKIKIGLAEEHGTAVTLRGRTHFVFPAPKQVMSLETVRGLSEEKLVRLKGIASAALEGKLDAERLRAMSERDALRELESLRGIGPWVAAHVLTRGAASPDALPTTEPRVLHGVASAYGIAVPTVEQFAKLSDAWRPFRMWVCVLLARHLNAAGRWQNQALARERASLGRRRPAATSSPRPWA